MGRVHRRRRLLLAAVAALLAMRILTGAARADVVPEPVSAGEPVTDEPEPPRLHGAAAFAVGVTAGAALAAAIVGGLAISRRRRRRSRFLAGPAGERR